MGLSVTAQDGLVGDDQDGLSVTVRMACRFLYNLILWTEVLVYGRSATGEC